MAAPIRVALCDDHSVVRSGLRRILEDDTTVDIVGEAGTGEEALTILLRATVDVFVMDVSLPGEGGIAVTRRIREQYPATHVLMLTMHEDVAYMRKAFTAGAGGYVLKSAADADLLQALRTVAAGEQYVQPSLGAALLVANPETRTERVPELTSREKDILTLLALGHTNPEIATQLHLSARTIETYRSKIQVKLGVRSRAELARIARDAGLLD